jgi:iron complex transport system substrate-binding protein
MRVPAGLDRRTLLAAACCLAARGGAAGAGELSPPARIVSLDYGLTETLLALGVAPVGMVQVGAWADWVVEPALPAGMIDLGADREPNLELLAALRPDLIVTTPYLAAIRPVLERFAPTRTFSIYAPPGGRPYELSVAATRELAGVLGRATEGEALIARAEARMTEISARLRDMADIPLLIVSFLDAHHVRVYGAGSLFDDTLKRCGLANGWRGPCNYWGFATVGIEALAAVPESRLVYLEPVSGDVLLRLAGSPLWNSLAFVRAGRIQRLPAALMFGMLPSAMRFAALLGEHLAATGRSSG